MSQHHIIAEQMLIKTALKIRRGYDPKAYIKQAPLSWHALATILERDRPVARRVLVGSHGSPGKESPSSLPGYMLEAQSHGYELNVMDRVFKYRETTPSQRSRGGNGYATTSGYSSEQWFLEHHRLMIYETNDQAILTSSGSDGTSVRLKMVAEQGVDELLHMKMLESMVDTLKPATVRTHHYFGNLTHSNNPKVSRANFRHTRLY